MSAIVLHGKHALVTGGGRGIGLAIAQSLARQGVRLSLLSRTITQKEVRAAGIRDFITLKYDVSDESAVREAFHLARGRHGTVDILVNNAGVAWGAPFTLTDRKMWDRVFAVNVTGTYLCTKAAIQDMLRSEFGRIVNVASSAGLAGAPYISAYSASKHAVVGLTRSLAEEYRHKNITVNAVCPGYTETGMMEQAISNIKRRTGMSEAQVRQELAKSNREGRLLTPGEVADAVLALCEETATGRCVVLPGGETC